MSLYLLFFFFSYRKEIRKEAKEKEKIKYKLNQVSAYLEMLTKKPQNMGLFVWAKYPFVARRKDIVRVAGGVR